MRRVGAAMVELIRQIDAAAKFVVVEAAPVGLAHALVEFWTPADPRLPRLAIACEDPAQFGDFGLREASAAGLRNLNPNGICIVVCEGFELAERQSINGFVPVSSGVLLESKNNLMLMADAVQSIRHDGPVAAIREALVTLPAGERPSAARVAAFFDALAMQRDPMESLPILGAFRDKGVARAELRSDRVKENLALANMRRSDAVVRPGVYADIRSQAERVLARRGADDRALTANTFMELLEAGNDELLSAITFDEAREILTSGTKGLAATVRAELTDYRRRLNRQRRGDAESLPWEEYRSAADRLDRATDRKDAARDLLGFDAAESEAVFLAATRRRLQNLLRDRSISASWGSAPEVGLARAIKSLQAVPVRLTLVDPHPATPALSQSAARAWLSLATARVRLAGVLRVLESVGCEVDGDLLLEAFEGLDSQRVRDLFTEAGLWGSSLPAVKVKVHGPTGSVEMSWVPDIDDVAMLRCLVEFSETRMLTFRCGNSPEPLYVAGSPALFPLEVPEPFQSLAECLQSLASDALRNGIRPERLRAWAADWTEAVEEARGFRGGRSGETVALAGCVEGPAGGRENVVGMTVLSPLKAEWLADYMEAARALVDEAIASLDIPDETVRASMAFELCAQAIAGATASHYPAFFRLSAADQPLLPAKESRIWTVFGGRSGVLNFEAHALAAVDRVLRRLLRLQPEAAGHLRFLAVGPGSASLLLREAATLAGQRVGGAEVSNIEIFAVGPDEPDEGSLAEADEHRINGDTEAVIQLRYVSNLSSAIELLGQSMPSVHLALVTGLTTNGGQPSVNSVEIPIPELDDEILFGPRVWQRPETEMRILLVPPGPTSTALAWLRLAQAIDDRWPDAFENVAAPEMRTGVTGVAEQLRVMHDLALWVATLDRYATRDSLERALGDEVAILHQEQRLGSDSPIGLVVSQKAGGPVDRAIGRSLRQARIVNDEGAAVSIGAELRKVASQGYGILALEAATSGTGINELVGHVVGFSMLGQTSTPWPLPPGCRVVLVSLDEHPHWFIGQKRADLLALAIDIEEMGLHGAVIEVKARRSDEVTAASEALDQLKKTLLVTSFAAHPQPGSLPTRVWLNRIAEAIYAVARESRMRLSRDELSAIEEFRRGRSTLEWAGVGLVFGPGLSDLRRIHRQAVDNDWVPIAMHDVRLTQQRLQDAVATDLRELRTAEAEATPLDGGRRRRRPETGVPRIDRSSTGGTQVANEGFEPPETDPSLEEVPEIPAVRVSDSLGDGGVQTPTVPAFSPPILGWDQFAASAVRWRAAGPDSLSNGHVQIWGSSGTGKTQFVKILLAQLALSNDTHFGIADFKNDYGPTDHEDFPTSVGADFIDMWGRPGALYNPLALDDPDGIDAQVIEFRDSIEQAVAAYQRVGQRQKQAIERALRTAYRSAAPEGRWPTMLDLGREVGDDIAHILGDLTRYEIFADGPQLGAVINRNVVFGLHRIPGNGQTTVLAAAFLLSVISLTMQRRSPVANTVNYALVIDEAHRVAQFRAVDLMIREGRSRGLAVILATQAPSDLPEVVDTNAQTRVCFRLSDAVIAAQAARKLDPGDDTLPERIRTLGTGEALVSFGGGQPRLMTMGQYYRDGPRLLADGIVSPPDQAQPVNG